MTNRRRFLHWAVVVSILGVALHVAPAVAHAQGSGTGPPVFKAKLPTTVTARGCVAPLVTPGAHAGVGRPSPIHPRGEQSLP